MNKIIFSPWPSSTAEEADTCRDILLSNKVNYWTGDQGKAFEQEFAAFADARYAIAVANGTLALDLALIAIGIKPGDEVVVTPRTYMASVSSVVTAGASPVFADVDLNSQNITLDSIKAVCTPKTRAIVVVHLAGMPADMDPIMAFANQHGLYVIEDCAQAHGARYKGRSVGSIGDIGTWSFCQDKIMTTGGEGGMVTCNDESLWHTMWSYKDHGKSYDAVYNTSHPFGFRWLHSGFGSNFRLTEMQSAIGRIQLKKMPDWTAYRQKHSAQLDELLKTFPCIRTVVVDKSIYHHACYKHYAFIKPEYLKPGWCQDTIIQAINDLGVPCFHGSCPEVYLEKAFDGTGWRPAQRLPNAEVLGRTSLMFLVHPTLTDDNMDYALATIYKVLTDAQA